MLLGCGTVKSFNRPVKRYKEQYTHIYLKPYEVVPLDSY